MVNMMSNTPSPQHTQLHEKRKFIILLLLFAMVNFLLLVAFGSVGNVVIMVVWHFSYLRITVFGIVKENPVVLFQNKFMIFVYMATTCFASLVIIFIVSAYAVAFAFFAWILAFIVVFYPDLVSCFIMTFFTNVPSITVMLLVPILAIVIKNWSFFTTLSLLLGIWG
ncbi:hypothetical protein TSUD_74110 [Trifolium subterraneum]|uniref:Uncharacterized protein n=1 Tax=Trifolium subterraneum TaxID=3900 RepID=A0A2Z6P0N7_TRISU|nr:hypothetical protein TSUD_74110 [Trifolium subterraneum]